MADMTLEEALAAATVDDGSETVYCTVDDDTRLVTIPEKYKKLGVESDEKAKRIWFRFPKLVGNNGVDLSAIGVRVNFRNANGDGDIYIVEDLTTDGDYVIFSWELTRKVTAYKGHVSFVVCAVKSAKDGTTKNEWNTTLNKECEVLEGLEVSEQITQENPDIIEYILANLGGNVSAEQIAQAVEAYMEGHPSYAVEYQPQTLSDDQKQQARTNIGAASFDEIPSKTSDLQNDSGFLTEHQDLSNYALKSEIPKTAADVGAEASGTAESKVSVHNTATDSHNDIRELISGLTQRLNALADSDDTTLDQMSEVVAYIKSNKSLIDAITTSKINVSDIIDNLTTNVSNKPLSAAQGVALKALIDGITIPEKLPNPQKLTFGGAVTAEYDGSAPLSVEIPSGGGVDSWELVNSVTTSEEVTTVEISTNSNGETFSHENILVAIYVPYGESITGQVSFINQWNTFNVSGIELRASIFNNNRRNLVEFRTEYFSGIVFIYTRKNLGEAVLNIGEKTKKYPISRVKVITSNSAMLPIGTFVGVYRK